MPQVKDIIQIRRDTHANWLAFNPILHDGEYGLETDTYLLKIGNGITHWNNLKYLNKLDPSCFKEEEDGTITFSDEFTQMVDSFIQSGDTIEQLIITNTPTLPLEIATKGYVDQVITQQGHLKHRVVNSLPPLNEADPDSIYLVRDNGIYKEYFIIDGEFECVGSGYMLTPATSETLGGVRASDDIGVDANGFMTINRVSTSKLYVPSGDTFILCGGSSAN